MSLAKADAPRQVNLDQISALSHFESERGRIKMAERVQCLYRVSTAQQVDHDVDNHADIPMQRKACREFAEKMGWIIVGEEQETGVSGYKVSADDRDKLQLVKKRRSKVSSIFSWCSCLTGWAENRTKRRS